jgi:hypothetical protein
VPEALARAGAVTLTGEKMRAGYAEAQLGIVSDELMMLWNEGLTKEEAETEEAERGEDEWAPF